MTQPTVDDPDVKWIIRHTRMTDVLMFGPFDTYEDALAWSTRNKCDGSLIPLLPPRVEDDGYHGLWEGWKR